MKTQISNTDHLIKMKKEKIKVIGGKNNISHMIASKLLNIVLHSKQDKINQDKKIINLLIKFMLLMEG